ncbi:MAG: peptidyl-tRNA hydrolase [Candidatus Diapherotrites archaeon]|nr:peptidyl-tRNA hydrolase [Candidatus Diapherotrites archaeon]
MENYKQVVLIRNDLNMGKGKIAAQAGHAFVEAYKKTKMKNPDAVDIWEKTGGEKVVLKVSSESELIKYYDRLKRKFPTVLITDAGHTQIKSGTKTCIGVGPVKESEIDPITSELKLL